jgi:hypothetical protein
MIVWCIYLLEEILNNEIIVSLYRLGDRNENRLFTSRFSNFNTDIPYNGMVRKDGMEHKRILEQLMLKCNAATYENNREDRAKSRN